MKRLSVLVGLIMVLVASAFGQAADDKVYKLKPEDVLRIQVFGRQEIAADCPVGDDGYIRPPFLSLVKVQGKTITEVKAELFTLYVKELKLRDPIVSVTITAYRRMKASINGMVNRSGDVFFRQGDTLMTLLSSGGGAVPDRADLRKATLRRQGSRELIPVDLYALTVLGDNSQNYDLQDGDVLDVPEEQKNRVLILGAIRSPGLYPYRETMRLADAISVAGGEIRYLSRFSRTFILRELPGRPGEYLRINADFVKFIKQGDYAQNVKLLPGDLVYIPETNTPDGQQLQSIVNTAFVLNTFSSFLGIRILR